MRNLVFYVLYFILHRELKLKKIYGVFPKKVSFGQLFYALNAHFRSIINSFCEEYSLMLSMKPGFIRFIIASGEVAAHYCFISVSFTQFEFTFIT